LSAIVFAYHDVGCIGLRTLARLGLEVAAVYTHADDPHENTWFGSVRATCEELGLPVRVGADPNAADELEFIRALRPRTFFSFYYRDLLRKPLLALPSGAAVNLHGSLLPRYRGRAPVNWQLLHGEREGGVTLHHMVAKPDAGDVVDQESFPIGPDDRPTDVFARLLPAAERVIERSARAVVDGTAPRARQLESKATTFGRRRPEDGLIDWHLAAADVRNLVRAVTEPYPGAFSHAYGSRVLVWWAEHEPAPSRSAGALAPGTIEHAGQSLLVSCGDGRRLRLTDVEIEGQRGDGWLHSARLENGLRLTAEAMEGAR